MLETTGLSWYEQVDESKDVLSSGDGPAVPSDPAAQEELDGEEEEFDDDFDEDDFDDDFDDDFEEEDDDGYDSEPDDDELDGDDFEDEFDMA